MEFRTMQDTFRSVRTGRVTGLAFALLLFLGAGCSDAGDQDERRPGSPDPASPDAGDAPSLYLDQVVQMLENGRNAQLEGYRHRVESCRNAGIATQPLPSSDEHLVGTSRWRMWRDREHLAYRMETWHAEPPDAAGTPEALCTFTLALTGIHGYVDAQRSILVDLETGARTEGEGNPDIVLASVDASSGSDPQAGSAPETVAGQSCNRWRSQRGGTACVWSGGARWGFASHTDRGFNPGAGMHADQIVLDADAPPDAIGYELETTTFVVGAPLDQDAMMP
ncbi:hypothetical protein GCM10007164_26660 [Luteimonas padinae]|nr:hypothetical protein GCM10007164_26660 [Luteimonas padinae]